MDDLGEGSTSQRPESVERPADRHQRKSRYVLGDAEQSLDLILAADVVGGDYRAEAKGTAGEDDVLHGGVDAGTANTVGVGDFVLPADGNVGWQRLARRKSRAAPAGEEKNGRLTHMLPEMGAGGHQAGELSLGQVRRANAGRIHRFRYVGGLAIDHAELSPPLGIAHNDERPVLRVSAGGSANCRVEEFGDQLLGYRTGLSRRNDRAEWIASNSPISGIVNPASAQIDGVALEQLKWDNLKGRFMGRGQPDLWRFAGLERFHPTLGTQTPAIAGL